MYKRQLIVRAEAPGDAYVHSSHIADLTLGAGYDYSMKYTYAIGTQYGTLRLYQIVGSTLTQIGAAHSLIQDTWVTLSFAFTAIATGALQARVEFASKYSEEGDQIRIDAISVKPA